MLYWSTSDCVNSSCFFVNSKRTVTRGLGYSMGKAAIDLYTKWFAVEMANRYGDAVRINSIMPGFFLTKPAHWPGIWAAPAGAGCGAGIAAGRHHPRPPASQR